MRPGRRQPGRSVSVWKCAYRRLAAPVSSLHPTTHRLLSLGGGVGAGRCRNRNSLLRELPNRLSPIGRYFPASFNLFRRIRYGMGRRAASPPREELGTPLPVPGRFGGRRGEARARGPARPPPPGRTDIVRERMTAWVAHPHAPPRPDLRPSLHGRRAAMSRPTALPRRHFHVDAPAPHRAVETMTAPIPDRARMCAATAGTDGRTP